MDHVRHMLDLCFAMAAEAREHGHADWREAAATALQALLAWPASEAFRQPVDPGYAAYHKVGSGFQTLRTHRSSFSHILRQAAWGHTCWQCISAWRGRAQYLQVCRAGVWLPA